MMARNSGSELSADWQEAAALEIAEVKRFQKRLLFPLVQRVAQMERASSPHQTVRRLTEEVAVFLKELPTAARECPAIVQQRLASPPSHDKPIAIAGAETFVSQILRPALLAPTTIGYRETDVDTLFSLVLCAKLLKALATVDYSATSFGKPSPDTDQFVRTFIQTHHQLLHTFVISLKERTDVNHLPRSPARLNTPSKHRTLQESQQRYGPLISDAMNGPEEASLSASYHALFQRQIPRPVAARLPDQNADLISATGRAGSQPPLKQRPAPSPPAPSDSPASVPRPPSLGSITPRSSADAIFDIRRCHSERAFRPGLRDPSPFVPSSMRRVGLGYPTSKSAGCSPLVPVKNSLNSSKDDPLPISLSSYGEGLAGLDPVESLGASN